MRKPQAKKVQKTYVLQNATENYTNSSVKAVLIFYCKFG